MFPRYYMHSDTSATQWCVSGDEDNKTEQALTIFKSPSKYIACIIPSPGTNNRFHCLVSKL